MERSLVAADDFGPTDPVVYRGAYEFGVPDVAEDFVPQHMRQSKWSRSRARQSGEMNSGK